MGVFDNGDPNGGTPSIMFEHNGESKLITPQIIREALHLPIHNIYNIFIGNDKMRHFLTLLAMKYEGFMAKPKESITEVFERFNELINDLQLHDKYFEAEEVNLKFLLTIPDHLQQKISAIRK
ncbi:hypothetical protein AgCh_038001 [Apium graveolens]